MGIEELEKRLRETLGNVVVDRIKEKVPEPEKPKPVIPDTGISNTIQNWFYQDFNKKWVKQDDGIDFTENFFTNPFDSDNEGGVF